MKSDSEGQGSSTTTLHETSVQKLFSGENKHVNVHEGGAGNPPILSCADLRAKSSISATDTPKESHHHDEVPAMLSDEQMAKLEQAGRKRLLACQQDLVHEVWGDKQAAQKEIAFLSKQARRKGTTVQPELWFAGYRCPEEIPGMENLEVE